MKHNDLDLKNWKESDINTDSLWIINQRDKSGKHKNIYHGNFIPQIPNQLIRRYTKKMKQYWSRLWVVVQHFLSVKN